MFIFEFSYTWKQFLCCRGSTIAVCYFSTCFKFSLFLSDLRDRSQSRFDQISHSHFFQIFLCSFIRMEKLTILDIPEHAHESWCSAPSLGISPEGYVDSWSFSLLCVCVPPCIFSMLQIARHHCDVLILYWAI